MKISPEWLKITWACCWQLAGGKIVKNYLVADQRLTHQNIVFWARIKSEILFTRNFFTSINSRAAILCGNYAAPEKLLSHFLFIERNKKLLMREIFFYFLMLLLKLSLCSSRVYVQCDLDCVWEHWSWRLEM